MNERINEFLELISSFILISLLFGDIFTLTFKSLNKCIFLSLFRLLNVRVKISPNNREIRIKEEINSKN